MAIRRCPYCKAIIDESQKYCNNCGTQLLFPEDEEGEEPIKGEKILDEDFPGDQGSEEFTEELRDEDELEEDTGGDREEIDLVPEKTGDEDLTFVDLREAEPDLDTRETVRKDIEIEKPDTLGETSFPEIQAPEKADTEPVEIAPPERPFSRRKKAAAKEEPSSEIVKPSEPGPEQEVKIETGKKPLKGRQIREAVKEPTPAPEEKKNGPHSLAPNHGDSKPAGGPKDTKLEIARLIADFERRRKAQAAEFQAMTAEPKEDEPAEPFKTPTEAEIGPPPTSEELTKADEALREGGEGDFATDYEFIAGEKEATETAPKEDRLPFLVESFKKAETEEELVEEPAEKREEKHPVFVTADFEESRLPDNVEEKDREIQETRRGFLEADRAEEIVPAPPEAALPPQHEEKAALISRILKKRAESGHVTKESREMAESLAALKSAKPVEPLSPPTPVEIPEPPKGKPPSRENSAEFPSGDTIDFENEVLDKSGVAYPGAPTKGIPEPVTSSIPPLPLEAEAPEQALEPEMEITRTIEPEAEPERVLEVEPEPEPEPEPEIEFEPEPELVPEPEPEPEPEPIPEPERERVALVERIARKARPKIEKPVEPPPPEIEAEKTPAEISSPPPVETAPVAAPIVRLGFFRRIKAIFIDLLIIGLFWLVAAGVASRMLDEPIIDLIIDQAGALGILYGVLMVVYFFMFFLFLGETPGGRLVTPKLKD